LGFPNVAESAGDAEAEGKVRSDEAAWINGIDETGIGNGVKEKAVDNIEEDAEESVEDVCRLWSPEVSLNKLLSPGSKQPGTEKKRESSSEMTSDNKARKPPSCGSAFEMVTPFADSVTAFIVPVCLCSHTSMCRAR